MFAQKMKKMSFLVGIQATFMLMLLALFCSTAAAQTTATIVGLVTDTSDAAIPGAKVTIMHPATGVERSFETDSTGNYLFTLLPIGDYSVRVERAGFKTWTVPKVTLAAADRLRLDARLEVGELRETIEVTAQTPALQTQSATLGTLVTHRATQDLPLVTRNFVALVQLAPGANDTSLGYGGGSFGGTPIDRRQTSMVAVNSQLALFNNFLIDGMDNNERWVGTVIVKPSIDAIAEMKIQTNVYSAALGRTAGAVVEVVTQSGTNSFHGSLFEFWRNEKLDAANFFAKPGARPPYKQNQFGGSLGGPVKKDRTFFFGDYEGFHSRLGRTFVATVPTLNMRNGDFSELLPTNQLYNPNTGTPFAGNIITSSDWDTVGNNVFQLYPSPTSSGRANNYTSSPSYKQDQNTFDVKLDHRISDQNSIFGRYSFSNTVTFLPPAIPIGDAAQAGTSWQRSQGAQLNYIRTFSPRLLMRLRAGYGRYHISSYFLNRGKNLSEQVGLKGSNLDDLSSGLANFAVAGATGIGDGLALPNLVTNNVYQGNGDITYQKGSHTIEIGGAVRRRPTMQATSFFVRGFFPFTPSATANPQTLAGGNSFASLLMGAPFSALRQRYLVIPGYKLREWDSFVQDSWRITPWLTLNLGFRYDYISPNSERHNRLTNFDPTKAKLVVVGQEGLSDTAGVQKDWNNFSPRFGFAATLAKRTVLRGGYGISYVPVMLGQPYAFRNPPFISTWSMPPGSGFRLSQGMPAFYTPDDPTNPSGQINAVDFHFPIPYVQQFNLTLQRELPLGLVGSVAYVGLLGRNQAFVGQTGFDLNEPYPGPPSTVQQRRPYYSQLPNVTTIPYYTLRENTSYNALQATLERRSEKGLGFVANYTWSHALDDGEYRPLPTGTIMPKANSFLDMRHRFTLTLVYELPFGKSTTGFAGGLAKGWQANAIAQLQTGIPFSVANAGDIAGNASASFQGPNLIGDPHLPSSDRTLQRWFNTAAFQQPTPGTYGNLGRLTMFGPGAKLLDFSVFKNFSLRENMQLQFRAEAFNIFNHPNFANPSGTFPSGVFGTISSTAFGAIGQPRNMQLALKLTF
ncbi:MAG: TonB-dependent receptor [Acidobacteria bacterium]|nr:TonB-dependent receptor [Acidobacteriota bacterium]